jgi:hypothetical protein
MQNGIQGETEGEGKPYLGTYVHDIPTFWEWMVSSYVNAQFKSPPHKHGDRKIRLEQYPYPGRFASYNQIIGGTEVLKHATAGADSCGPSELLNKIYNSYNPSAGCHKKGGSTGLPWFRRPGNENKTYEYFFYHMDWDDLKKHVNTLRDINWIDQNTINVDFRNLYYNGELSLFTHFQLRFIWDVSGAVKISFVDMETFQADPYSNKIYIAIDALYVLIMLRMIWQELQEMIPRLMNGLDGFIQYWEFWNVVDWLNIALGTFSFVLWGMICTETSGALQESISGLPTTQLNDWIKRNATFFTEAELSAELIAAGTSMEGYKSSLKLVLETSEGIASLMQILRIVIFFYSFSLMLKFFKAFQANPRLNIVVMTLIDSFVDIVHFAIVFLTIFFVFSVMAHVIFGDKMDEFHDNETSFFTCFAILLGDFPLEDMMEQHFMLANVWFICFQVMVMMILLNMLLAIIMDTYTNVVAKSGKKTIWEQTSEAVQKVRETRGHLSLLYLRCEMEDQDEKAHKGDRVTAKSLRKAFERDKMSRENAIYLIQKTNEYLAEHQGESDLRMSDAVRLVGQTKNIVMKIETTTDKALDMLVQAERAPMEARRDAIMAGFDPDDPHAMAKMRAAGALKTDNLSPSPPVLTQGVPYQTGQMNQMSMVPYQSGNMSMQMSMQTSYNGMASVNGMYNNGVNGAFGTQHPLAPDHQTQTQIVPFTPANADHSRYQAPAQLSRLSPRQSDNGFSNSQRHTLSHSYDNTGQSFSNMVGRTSGTTPQQHVQQDQVAEQVMAKMNEMQQCMEIMTNSNNQLRAYIEQRDDQMELKYAQLNRRCEKVEALSDRLYNILRGFDLNEIAKVPREVSNALKIYSDQNARGPDNEARDPSKASYAIGEKVEARSTTDDVWHPATIQERVGDGVYQVSWDDGDDDFRSRTKTLQELRRKGFRNGQRARAMRLITAQLGSVPQGTLGTIVDGVPGEPQKIRWDNGEENDVPFLEYQVDFNIQAMMQDDYSMSPHRESARLATYSSSASAPEVHYSSTNDRGSSKTRSGSRGRNADEQLVRMSEQIAELLSHAEATPQMSKLLWRIDLNLRKLTGTANNLPANHHLLQQPVPQMVQQQDTRSPSHRSSISGRPSLSGRPSRRDDSKSTTNFLPVPEGN